MYAIMSDLGKYLVNRYGLCLKGSNMPRPPLYRPTKFYKKKVIIISFLIRHFKVWQ